MADNIKKSWNVYRQDDEKVAELMGEFKIRETTARLLINRGLTEADKARNFLNKSRDLLHDPFLMNGMNEAVARIHKAYENHEKVLIFGDYDVDGISATCMIYIYLKNAGIDVSYYIPDRFEEGYGLNMEAVQKAGGNNINLIITVDCGVTALAETEYARKFGIDMIITDHHECPDILPKAVAVINPKKSACPYPFKELSGVGVAFKLISAYDKIYGKNFKFNYYCEFAAMGTIADIMPLVGENRVLVDIGLKSMRESENHGITALLDSYYKFKGKKNASADIISYYIAPRINAAGRLYKADKAVELFLAKSRAAADMIADELNRLNKRRQDMEKEIFAQAEEEMEKIGGRIDEDKTAPAQQTDKKIFVLCRDEWNQGVIGIAASKLTEKYNKVFILLARDSNGIYKGSCRSVDNINITEALKSCGDILLKYGGHEKAAGLSIERENIEELDFRLNKYAEDNNETNSEKIYNIECTVKPKDFDCRAIREIEILEPFGTENAAPVFVIEKCKIINIIPMGENKHLRLELRDNINFEAVYFNMEPENFIFEKFDLIDIACSAGINEYAGKEKAQFIIRDMRYSGQAELELYNNFIKNKSMTEISALNIPDREDFISVYNFLLKFLKKDIWYEKEYNIDKIYGKLPDYKNISGFKFRIILDIFAEAGITDIEHDLYYIKKIRINTQNKKTDLEQTKIYARLKSLQERS